MNHIRTICFAVFLSALVTIPGARPAHSAEPKDVCFSRRGSITCPSVRVPARATGEVVRWLRDIGDSVKEGAVLAELRDPEIEADLKLAEAELALAVATEKEFVATKGGKVDASPAKEQLARLAAQVKVAEARVASAKERLAALTVRSPINGVVGKRSIDRGDYVRKGETELFTILDLARIEAVVNVPELDSEHVKKEQRCTINLDALPGREVAGVVDRIEPNVETPAERLDVFGRLDRRPEGPRTFRVYVTLRPTKEQENIRLLPGMTAQVGFGPLK
jgi:RND family efflux transporter MFP subunit